MVTSSELISNFSHCDEVYIFCTKCDVWCTGSVPASGVKIRCVIRLINRFEVVIVLPCFNLLSSCIDVVISPALLVTDAVTHYDTVAIPYMNVV